MSGIGNSNLLGLRLAALLGRLTEDYARSTTRIATGLRINSPQDDPAALIVADALKSNRRVAAQGAKNLNDGISMLNVAAGALDALSSINSRLRELTQQAQSSIITTAQRNALQEETDALVAEFNRIASTTTYNGINLLNSSMPTVNAQAGMGTDGIVPLLLPIGSGTSTITVTTTTVIPGSPGQGNGTFSTQYNVAVPSDTHDLRAVDVNGDGQIDLIGVSENVGTGVVVLLGNGNGTFAAGVTYKAGDQGTNLELGDVNGDGVLDIVNTNIYASDNLTILLGNSNGSFRAPTTFSTGVEPRGLALQDITGDGVLDIITGNMGSGTVSVLIGNGNGTFRAQVCYAGGMAPQAVRASDLNGDGNVDLIVNDGFFNPRISILLGNGNGSFAAPVSYSRSGANENLTLRIADFTGDGLLDIAGIGGGDFTLLAGNGDGTFKTHFTIQNIINSVAGYGGGLAMGNFNADTNLDLAVTDRFNDKVIILLGNGNGTFAISTSYSTGAGPRFVETADLNGDGILDLTTPNFDGTTFSLFFGQGTAAVPATTTSSSVTVTSYNSLYLPDLDLSSVAYAAAAESIMDSMEATISLGVARVSASLSRAESALSFTQSSEVLFAEAESSVTSIDAAYELSNWLALAIRREAAAALLAQANQNQDQVLNLLVLD